MKKNHSEESTTRPNDFDNKGHASLQREFDNFIDKEMIVISATGMRVLSKSFPTLLNVIIGSGVNAYMFGNSFS